MDRHWCAGHGWAGHLSKHTLSNCDSSSVFLLGCEICLCHLLFSFTDIQYLSNSLASAWMGLVQNIHAERQWCYMYAKELSSKLLYRLPEVSSSLFNLLYSILFFYTEVVLFFLFYHSLVLFCFSLFNTMGWSKVEGEFCSIFLRDHPFSLEFSSTPGTFMGHFCGFFGKNMQAVCHCLFL